MVTTFMGDKCLSEMGTCKCYRAQEYARFFDVVLLSRQCEGVAGDDSGDDSGDDARACEEG